MASAHLLLALATAFVVAAGLADAAWRVAGHGNPVRVLAWGSRLVIPLVVFTAAVGLAEVLGGRAPQSRLHYAYAVAALAAVPLWRAAGRRIPDRAAVYQLVGSVLLLGVLVRLYLTAR